MAARSARAPSAEVWRPPTSHRAAPLTAGAAAIRVDQLGLGSPDGAARRRHLVEPGRSALRARRRGTSGSVRGRSEPGVSGCGLTSAAGGHHGPRRRAQAAGVRSAAAASRHGRQLAGARSRGGARTTAAGTGRPGRGPGSATARAVGTGVTGRPVGGAGTRAWRRGRVADNGTIEPRADPPVGRDLGAGLTRTVAAGLARSLIPAWGRSRRVSRRGCGLASGRGSGLASRRGCGLASKRDDGLVSGRGCGLLPARRRARFPALLLACLSPRLRVLDSRVRGSDSRELRACGPAVGRDRDRPRAAPDHGLLARRFGRRPRVRSGRLGLRTRSTSVQTSPSAQVVAARSA